MKIEFMCSKAPDSCVIHTENTQQVVGICWCPQVGGLLSKGVDLCLFTGWQRDRKTGEEKKLLIINLMVQAGDSSGVCYLGQVP